MKAFAAVILEPMIRYYTMQREPLSYRQITFKYDVTFEVYNIQKFKQFSSHQKITYISI